MVHTRTSLERQRAKKLRCRSKSMVKIIHWNWIILLTLKSLTWITNKAQAKGTQAFLSSWTMINQTRMDLLMKIRRSLPISLSSSQLRRSPKVLITSQRKSNGLQSTILTSSFQKKLKPRKLSKHSPSSVLPNQLSNFKKNAMPKCLRMNKSKPNSML